MFNKSACDLFKKNFRKNTFLLHRQNYCLILYNSKKSDIKMLGNFFFLNGNRLGVWISLDDEVQALKWYTYVLNTTYTRSRFPRFHKGSDDSWAIILTLKLFEISDT